jgi:hypothetical protein
MTETFALAERAWKRFRLHASLLKKGSKTLPERLLEEFVERYLDSAAGEVPLECILSGEDVLRRR